MFHDDVRALQAKKYEILGELELAKHAILRELSSVDKHTLSRLREIIAHYDRLEKSVIDKLNTREVSYNVFVSSMEKEFATFTRSMLSCLHFDEKKKAIVFEFNTPENDVGETAEDHFYDAPTTSIVVRGRV